MSRAGLKCFAWAALLVCDAGVVPTQRPALAGLVTIDTVRVGNAGNASDPSTGNLYGAVDYDFRIGKTEVTVGQYATFLNAVAARDTYGLYNGQMSTNNHVSGIVRSGVSGSYTYSVRGQADQPVTYVSWADAVRFANWLHNGQPTGGQNAGTTETGAYTLNGAVTNATLVNIARSPDAKWFLPSESEWYKAAYHKNDGLTGNYWRYPTSTDLVPDSAAPPGTGAPLPWNAANFFASDSATNGYDDGFAVTGSTVIDSNQNYLTNVGAYSEAFSPYGTLDQAGNVWEWNEGVVDVVYRSLRGGSWRHDASFLASSNQNYNNATYEYFFVGFRVANVPEPSSAALMMIAAAMLLAWKQRAG